MKLEQFIRERPESRNRKNRTLNIDEDLHMFFKQTANNYNIALSDLIYNVLNNWKGEYEEDVRNDMLKKFQK